MQSFPNDLAIADQATAPWGGDDAALARAGQSTAAAPAAISGMTAHGTLLRRPITPATHVKTESRHLPSRLSLQAEDMAGAGLPSPAVMCLGHHPQTPATQVATAPLIKDPA